MADMSGNSPPVNISSDGIPMGFSFGSTVDGEATSGSIVAAVSCVRKEDFNDFTLEYDRMRWEI